MFKRNEGIIDRIARVALGMVILPVGLFLLGGWQGSVLGLVVAGLGVLGLGTGLTGVSILYLPFGISTLEKEKELIDKCVSMGAGCWSSESMGRMCGPGSQAIENTPKQEG